MNAVTLLLVRHGATAWNLEGRLQGRTDLPLAPEGKQQAEAAAADLVARKTKFDRLYASPLRRCLQTAEIIAGRTGHKVEVEPGLIERDCGAAAGALWSRLPEDFPVTVEDDGWYQMDAVEGMEAEAVFIDRVLTAYRRLVEKHPGEILATVTHAGVITFLLTSAFRRERTGIRPDPGAVIDVRASPELF